MMSIWKKLAVAVPWLLAGLATLLAGAIAFVATCFPVGFGGLVVVNEVLSTGLSRDDRETAAVYFAIACGLAASTFAVWKIGRVMFNPLVKPQSHDNSQQTSKEEQSN